MAFTVNKLDVVFVQRDSSNEHYSQKNISGSNAIVFLDNEGELAVKHIDDFVKTNIPTIRQQQSESPRALLFGEPVFGTDMLTAGRQGGLAKYKNDSNNTNVYTIVGTTTNTLDTANGISIGKADNDLSVNSTLDLSGSMIITGSLTVTNQLNATSSWATTASYGWNFIANNITSSNNISASNTIYTNILSASYANINNITANKITASLLGTSSWSSDSISASYAFNSTTSSYSLNTLSASWAESCSFALVTQYNTTQSFLTASYAESSSWASASISASYLLGDSYGNHIGNVTGTSSWASNAISTSYSDILDGFHASYFQPALTTGGTYTITSSWANNAINSIISQTGLYASQSNYSVSASIASSSISSSYLNGIHIGNTTGTASWSSNSITSSYFNQLWLSTSSLYPITSSWSVNSNNSISSSYFNQLWLNTASLYPITASWSTNAINSITASYFNQLWLTTSSLYPITASWSEKSITASYFNQLWLNTGSTYPITSSWANTSKTASFFNQLWLTTSSLYPITSSWSLNSTTASYIANLHAAIADSSSWASSSISSSNANTASLSLATVGSGGYLCRFVPTNGSNILLNAGFETFATASGDYDTINCEYWINVIPGTTSITGSNDAHSGINAIQFNGGFIDDTYLYQTASVTSSRYYNFDFWNKSNNAGQAPSYAIYDLNNSNYLVSRTNIPVFSTTEYTKFTSSLLIPSTTAKIECRLYASAIYGVIIYYDDVSLYETEIVGQNPIYQVYDSGLAEISNSIFPIINNSYDLGISGKIFKSVLSNNISSSFVTSSNNLLINITSTNLTATNTNITYLTSSNNLFTRLNSTYITSSNNLLTNIASTNIVSSFITSSNNLLNNITSSNIISNYLTSSNNSLNNISSSFITSSNNYLINVISYNISSSYLTGSNNNLYNITSNTINSTNITGVNNSLTNINSSYITSSNNLLTYVTSSNINTNYLTSSLSKFTTVTATNISSSYLTGSNCNLYNINSNIISASYISASNFYGTSTYAITASYLTGSGKVDYIDFSNGTSQNKAAYDYSIAMPQRQNGILWPWYIYTNYSSSTFTDLWYPVLDAKKKRPSLPCYFIINPEPDPPAYDANYTIFIKECHSAGITVIGYVATNYGQQDYTHSVYKIDSWKSQYPELDGIFVDEFSNYNNASSASYYKNLTEYCHHIGYYPVIGNPGTAPRDIYLTNKTADYFLVRENIGIPGEDYCHYSGSYQYYNYMTRGIICHTTPTISSNDVQMLKKYFGLIYITDDSGSNPYNAKPTYWEELLDYLIQPQSTCSYNDQFNWNPASRSLDIPNGNLSIYKSGSNPTITIGDTTSSYTTIKYNSIGAYTDISSNNNFGLKVKNNTINLGNYTTFDNTKLLNLYSGSSAKFLIDLSGSLTAYGPPTFKNLAGTSVLYVDSSNNTRVNSGDVWCTNSGSNARLLLGDSTSTGKYGYVRWDSGDRQIYIDSGNGFYIQSGSQDYIIIQQPGNINIPKQLVVGDNYVNTESMLRVYTSELTNSRQLSVNNWMDISSNGNAIATLGSNFALRYNLDDYYYTINNHHILGPVGLTFNHQWNKVGFFFNTSSAGSGSIANEQFIPAYSVTIDRNGVQGNLQATTISSSYITASHNLLINITSTNISASYLTGSNITSYNISSSYLTASNCNLYNITSSNIDSLYITGATCNLTIITNNTLNSTNINGTNNNLTYLTSSIITASYITASNISSNLTGIATNAISSSYAKTSSFVNWPVAINNGENISYTLDAANVKNMSNTLPQAVWGGRVAVINKTTYYFGGYTAAPSTTIFSSSYDNPTIFTTVVGKTLPSQNPFNGELIIVGEKLYLLGGQSAGLNVNGAISTASIADPVTWGYIGELPRPLIGHKVVSLNNGNDLYTFGGTDIDGGGASAVAITKSYYATASNPMSWTITSDVVVLNDSPASLPMNGCITIIADKMYYYGGWKGPWTTNPSTNIYTASVNTPLSWSKVTNGGPSIIDVDQPVIIGDYIYIVGGFSGSWVGGAETNTIYRAPVSNPIQMSASGFTLPYTMRLNQHMIYSGSLYTYGGYNGGATTNYILSCSISSSGGTDFTTNVPLRIYAPADLVLPNVGGGTTPAAIQMMTASMALTASYLTSSDAHVNHAYNFITTNLTSSALYSNTISSSYLSSSYNYLININSNNISSSYLTSSNNNLYNITSNNINSTYITGTYNNLTNINNTNLTSSYISSSYITASGILTSMLDCIKTNPRVLIGDANSSGNYGVVKFKTSYKSIALDTGDDNGVKLKNNSFILGDSNTHDRVVKLNSGSIYCFGIDNNCNTYINNRITLGANSVDADNIITVKSGSSDLLGVLDSGNTFINGKVEIGDNDINTNSVLRINTSAYTASRQLVVNTWMDISSNGNAIATLGSNFGLQNNLTNTFYFTNTHDTLGAVGASFNHTWNKLGFFFNKSSAGTGSLANEVFIPSYSVTVDQYGITANLTGSAATALNADKLDGLHSSSFQATLVNGATYPITSAYANNVTASTVIGIPSQKIVLGNNSTGLTYNSGFYFDSNLNTITNTNIRISGSNDPTIDTGFVNKSLNINAYLLNIQYNNTTGIEIDINPTNGNYIRSYNDDLNLSSSNNIIIATSILRPYQDIYTDLGSLTYRYKNLYLSGQLYGTAAYALNSDTLDTYHATYFEPALVTGALYQITSSWSGYASTALTALTSSYAGGADHTTLTSLNSVNYYHLTQTNHTDLTDAGDTSLHYHSTDRDLANSTGILPATNLSGNYTSATAAFASNATYAAGAGNADTLDNLHSSSFQARLVTGGTYPITSSWSSNSITSAYASNANTADTCNNANYATTAGSAGDADTLDGLHSGSFQARLIAGGSYPITASWSVNADHANSSDTCSNATNALNATTAVNATSASHALIADNAYNSVTASLALNSNKLNGQYSNYYQTALEATGGIYTIHVSASNYALDSDKLDGQHGSYYQPALITGNTYTITSSWAENVIGGTGVTDHTALSNLNSANYTHLTATNHTDLTDSGDTTLHYHSADRDLANSTGVLPVAGLNGNYTNATAAYASNADTVDGVHVLPTTNNKVQVYKSSGTKLEDGIMIDTGTGGGVGINVTPISDVKLHIKGIDTETDVALAFDTVKTYYTGALVPAPSQAGGGWLEIKILNSGNSLDGTYYIPLYKYTIP